MFYLGRLLGVKVGNLNESNEKKEKHIESRIVGNPSFYLLNRGASLKSKEKEYTRGYKYWFGYNTHSVEVELEVGYIPSVGNLFPK